MRTGAAQVTARLGPSRQQRHLCRPVQRFDGGFTLQGSTFAVPRFGIPNEKRPPAFGVFRPPPAGMRSHAPLKIVCDAGVQAAVGTFQDVDDPRHGGGRDACRAFCPVVYVRCDADAMIAERGKRRDYLSGLRKKSTPRLASRTAKMRAAAAAARINFRSLRAES